MPARQPAPVASALREIQEPVRERLEAVPGEMWRIVSADDDTLVREVSRHLMSMRGKMFRPSLTLLASALEESPEPRAVPLAAVGELIHLATLVHDDSVDHSVLRRGMPTINSLFTHEIAVIFGDHLYARAVAELSRLGDVEPIRTLSIASSAMTLGELRQLAAFDALSFGEEDYYRLIRAKTASLLGAVCEVGALAGAQRHRASMARYGERLGMAFQIADDLLDYTEGSDVTGKPSGLDLRDHKVTLPLIAALREMNAASRARVDALFADPTPSDAHIEEVVAIVSENGGLDYARRRGEQFAEEAEDALTGVPDSAARSALTDAISYVMDRRW
ncbi:MAG TPA: polyprenyl synthetase family protein [Gemmatimonadaceae bacterium]|nr:polyprenyl synthetase family protein [Gemmatimonadaceae bacterium]